MLNRAIHTKNIAIDYGNEFRMVLKPTILIIAFIPKFVIESPKPVPVNFVIFKFFKRRNIGMKCAIYIL